MVEVGRYTARFVELACQGRASDIPYRPIRENLEHLAKVSPLCEAVGREEFRRGDAVAVWVPEQNVVWIFAPHRGWVHISRIDAKSEKFAKFVAENNAAVHVPLPDGGVKVEKKNVHFYVAQGHGAERREAAPAQQVAPEVKRAVLPGGGGRRAC